MEMRYRYYFLEAFLITSALFVIGFFIGWEIEQNRSTELSEYYLLTEHEIAKISEGLDLSNLGKYTCSELITRNSDLGNTIYQHALIFQNYEESAIFTDQDLIKKHREFDLLRTLFWINSIGIKERCGQDVFTTLVYLYDYPAKTNEEISAQRVMESITREIKSKYEDKLILIPIAKNLNLTLLDSLIQEFSLENDSVALIINEKDIFYYHNVSLAREFLEG